jgi:hypothetical protein
MFAYFQSQIKEAAINNRGAIFSARLENLKLPFGDKDLGLKLYFLYMFIFNK